MTGPLLLPNGFRLLTPWWALAAVAILMVWVIFTRRRQRPVVVFSDAGQLKRMPTTLRQHVRRGMIGCRWLACFLVVVALVQPQQGIEEFRVRTEGIAIQLCLDRSGSMRAEDFAIDNRRVNRLTAVKYVMRNFIAGDNRLSGRADDLIGLISFGGFAEAACPQTLDHDMLLEVLDGIEIADYVRDRRGNILNADIVDEERATAIGDAIALGVARLQDIEADSRVIVLVSDGENTAGAVSPAEAADAAREFGIRVYTIGIGSTGIAPMPQVDPFGNVRLISQNVRLDEETLKQIADKTGARYFNARTTDALAQIYADINQLERTKTEGLLYTRHRELFPWFLYSAVCILLIDAILRCTYLRSLP